MARTQFNRDEVIDNAVELFWKNGYTASSMQQVKDVTGLKPGSIYLAFGNKEGLFREALQRYAENSLEHVQQVLEQAETVGQGICSILEDILQASVKKDYCSCFIVKTQLELASEGNELYEYACDKVVRIEALYRTFLEREFDKEQSKLYATSLMLHIFGVRVYGYQKGSLERMRAGLQQGLPWLPWDQA